MKGQKLNFMKRITSLMVCFLAVMSFSSCSDDEVQVADFIPGEGFSENLTLLPAKGSAQINFTANGVWTAKSDQTWLKLDQKAETSGKEGAVSVYVSYEENLDVADRTANITMTVGATPVVVKVTQKAAGRVIAFDGADTLKMTKANTAFDAAIVANVEWELVADSVLPDWITVKVVETTVAEQKVNKLHVEILNQDGSDRFARVVLRDKNFPGFTQALIVQAVGWGEKFLEWTLDTVLFKSTGGVGTIAATLVEDLTPRALVSGADGVTAVVADWITFTPKVKSKAAVQVKEWTMEVDRNTNLKESRAALVFLVPDAMSDADVVAQKEKLVSQKVSQVNEEPWGKFVVWGLIGGKYGIIPGSETALSWTAITANTIFGGNIAIKFTSNCKFGNIREVKVINGVDMLANQENKIVPFTEYNTKKYEDNTKDYYYSELNAANPMAPEDRWVLIDLFDGDTKDVLKTVRYKLEYKGMM